MKSRKIYCLCIGALCGFLNGFFGAGGGTVLVPMLKKTGLSEKEAHATSVAVILVLTIVSAGIYLYRGDVSFSDSSAYMFTGVLGAVVGSLLLKKLSVKWIKRIFGFLIVVASVRMIIK